MKGFIAFWFFKCLSTFLDTFLDKTDCLETEPPFSFKVFVIIFCLPSGCPVVRYSCDQLKRPHVSMDSYTEPLTAVPIHKRCDWLRLRFIIFVIDCCWHNSCQQRKWWLTNDRVKLATREITSPLCEAKRQSSHIPVSFSVPFYCHTQSLPNR